jgi:hypothetical protein
MAFWARGGLHRRRIADGAGAMLDEASGATRARAVAPALVQLRAMRVRRVTAVRDRR